MNNQDRFLITAIAGAICSILGKIYIFLYRKMSYATDVRDTQNDFDLLLNLCNYTLIISVAVIIIIIIIAPIIKICIDRRRTESRS